MELICHTYFLHKALVFLGAGTLKSTSAQSLGATLRSEITNPKHKTENWEKIGPQKDTLKSLLKLRQEGTAFTLLDLKWTMNIRVTQTF